MRGKVSKIIALVLSVLALFLSLVAIENWESVGIYTGCGPLCRAIYPFFHANIIHAALNIWCLLSIVFIYDTTIWRLLFAYITAMSIPTLLLSATPTVGLSGIVFALFGSISFEVGRKLYYQAWMFAYLILGFVFPNTNAWIHLYCYAIGFVFALLNKPIKINRDDSGC